MALVMLYTLTESEARKVTRFTAISKTTTNVGNVGRRNSILLTLLVRPDIQIYGLDILQWHTCMECRLGSSTSLDVPEVSIGFNRLVNRTSPSSSTEVGDGQESSQTRILVAIRKV